EKAAAADEVSPIVCHGASIARLKVMGFAEPVIGPATSGRTRWLNPSYGLGQGERNHASPWTGVGLSDSRPRASRDGFDNRKLTGNNSAARVPCKRWQKNAFQGAHRCTFAMLGIWPDGPTR